MNDPATTTADYEANREIIAQAFDAWQRGTGPITDVFAGVMPFVGAYLLAVLILLMFPQAALFIVPR